MGSQGNWFQNMQSQPLLCPVGQEAPTWLPHRYMAICQTSHKRYTLKLRTSPKASTVSPLFCSKWDASFLLSPKWEQTQGHREHVPHAGQVQGPQSGIFPAEKAWKFSQSGFGAHLSQKRNSCKEYWETYRTGGGWNPRPQEEKRSETVSLGQSYGWPSSPTSCPHLLMAYLGSCAQASGSIRGALWLILIQGINGSCFERYYSSPYYF